LGVVFLMFRFAQRIGRTNVLRFRAPVRWAAKQAPAFQFQPMFEKEGADENTPWRKLTSDFVSEIEVPGTNRTILKIDPEALTLISKEAMRDVAHLLRPGHLQQLAKILKDPEASDNDIFVARELLKNANIASGMILPGCQDTGTAIIMGKKGENVWVDSEEPDEAALSKGVYKTYVETNLRYSQMAPLTMYKEKNTGSNLPAQIELYSQKGNEYKFLFVAKGGGSANKTFLYQQTKTLLTEENLLDFVRMNIKSIGTSACPPYHLALVVGGTSAEFNLKTVKLASCRYLDNLPTTGNDLGRAFRDIETEKQILKITQELGVGAQFG